jgi:NAD(P)-dependent dehydrogenase (short-subunit alcohol dehydrogenase family)
MELGLRGKIVLITSGSKGIGLACAHGFAAEGAKIAICARGQENINTALADLPGAIGVAADLTDPDAAAAMVREVEARIGAIDILVNSAGAARRSPPDDLTPAFYRTAMDAKFFAYINVIDPLVKLMAAKKSGVIINIIGAGGKIASPAHLAGGAANAALMLVTAGLGTAYAGQGIRVVGISPGLTETGRVAEGMLSDAKLAGISPEEARSRAIARIPLGRMAAPEEIANMAVFLASDKADYVTGITLTMDGASSPVVV